MKNKKTETFYDNEFYDESSLDNLRDSYEFIKKDKKVIKILISEKFLNCVEVLPTLKDFEYVIIYEDQK